MKLKIANNCVVTIDYELKDDEGNILDSSKDNGPLPYIHGHANIIPGLEEALLGKQVGEALKVSIPANKAYGEYEDSLVQKVKKEFFEPADHLREGVQFQAQTDMGTRIFTVVTIEGDDVTVDGNHPLAGMTLHFDVKITEVRAATEEEMKHGHLHGGAGCCGGDHDGGHCSDEHGHSHDEHGGGGCCNH
jgi:FKBP-type peptidyl-prolyl cis-trans isomerase SlyD